MRIHSSPQELIGSNSWSGESVSEVPPCFIPVARCSRLLAVSPEEIYLHVFSSMMTQTPPSVLSLANSNTQMQSGRRGPRSTSHIKVTRVASNTERPCSDPLNSVNSVPQIPGGNEI